MFPGEVLDCTNLVSLEIFRGIAWDGDARIPRAIGTLKKLRHLGLGGLGFTTLPEELGNLSKLEELELYYSDALTALPKSLGKLGKLRTLQCGDCEALAKLPTTIGELRELRELGLGGTALRTVPKELWKLTKLESLALPEDVTKLPPGISKLTSLETLSISARALASAATELPALTSLTHLHVDGKATTLPAELGRIANLVELSLGYLELTSLPPLGALTKLKRLDIGGNKLESVVHLVTELPKLEDLDYSDNPVDKAERRIVDAAMKRSPAKRKLGGVAKVKVAGPAPELIGKISSINASLTMAIADASILAAWRGIGDDDDLGDSDWDRARIATSARESSPVTFGGRHTAIALCLEMGSGIADVFRVGDALVLVEGIGEYLEDELFLEWLASPLVRPRTGGTVKLPTKTLAIIPSTDAGTKVKVAAGKIAKFGDDNCGRAIHVGHAAATLALEAPVKSSWGEARRCRIAFE